MITSIFALLISIMILIGNIGLALTFGPALNFAFISFSATSVGSAILVQLAIKNLCIVIKERKRKNKKS